MVKRAGRSVSNSNPGALGTEDKGYESRPSTPIEEKTTIAAQTAIETAKEIVAKATSTVKTMVLRNGKSIVLVTEPQPPLKEEKKVTRSAVVSTRDAEIQAEDTSKTKYIIGAVAAVALFAIGIYVGSQYFSGNSALIAEKDAVREMCSQSIKDITTSLTKTCETAQTATLAACEALKEKVFKEGYQAGNNDGNEICKEIINTIDASANCASNGKVVKLSEYYNAFREAVIGDIPADKVRELGIK